MSHFTVLVTNTHLKTIDEQLAPFDENLEKPRHIVHDKKYFIERGRSDVEYAKKKVAEYDAGPKAYEASTSNTQHIKWLKGEARETAKITDEEELFKLGAKWYLDDEENPLDENGNYWSTTNDDAKWDWYSIGGRWAGFFITKMGYVGKQGHHRAKDFASITGEEVEDLPEEAADIVRVNAIDWEAMEKRERKDRAEYFDNEMAKPKGERFIWQEEKDIEKNGKEAYVNAPVRQSTFAVLHDGVWYEKGSMGWWGMVSNEKDQDEWDNKFRELIDSLDPEAEVTIVDCHI